jgi:hypothetical protein
MKEWAMSTIDKWIASGDESGETFDLFLALGSGEQALLLKDIGASRSGEAVKFLVHLYERTPDKKLQKLVKKALFQLKTQGIAVEELKPAGESVLRRAAEAIREAKALLSSYDNELTRVVTTAFEIKKNQFALTHGVLHFTKGLVELRSIPVNRAEVDGILNEYISRSQSPVLCRPVSPPYSGYIIEEASNISGKEVDEARSLRHYLSEAQGEVRKPKDLHHLTVDSGAAAASIDDVITSEVFEPFRLDWPGTEEDRRAFDNAVNPSIVLPPYIAQERREAFLKNLAESEGFHSIVPRFRRMLEDTAYLFYQSGRHDYYLSLMNVLKDERATNKALIYFVQKTFQDLAKTREQNRELIVDPFAPPRDRR